MNKSNNHCSAARFIRSVNAGRNATEVATDLGGSANGTDAYLFGDGSAARLSGYGVWLGFHEFNGRGAAKASGGAA